MSNYEHQVFVCFVQDRVIFHRLENICHCIERGEWPGGHRYAGSLLTAVDSHSSTPVPGTPTSTPMSVDSANSAAAVLERLVSFVCTVVAARGCSDTFVNALCSLLQYKNLYSAWLDGLSSRVCSVRPMKA